MPKDKRLYITLPIDIHRHPKLTNQPPAVKWAFVEMNIEAVIAGNDGRFAAEDAEFLWPIEILDALVKTHPTRPLVYRDVNGGDYVIREFAEHQMTTDDRERRAQISRANGAKGGRPRKNPERTQEKPDQVATGTQVEPDGTRMKAESESESEDYYLRSQSQSSSNRARGSTDSEVSPATKRLASQAGITSLQSVIASARKHAHREIDSDGAFRLGAHLIAKAKTYPRNPQMYVTRSISLSPFEVQQFIDENALAVAS